MTQQQMPAPRQGPVCQSGSMSLGSPEDFGTEADGSQSEEYCRWCYEEGAFGSDLTMAQMIEVSATVMSDATGEPEQQVRETLAGALPGLKRWRAA